MVKIIQAENQDMIKKLYRLRFEVFVKEQKVPAELENDEYDKKAYHVLAIEEKSGECIACGRVIIEDDRARIGRVAVKKDYRKKGYGKKICLKLIEIAQKYNVKDIGLDAQLPVTGFYKKLGFKEYGNVFLEANMEHIAMKLTDME
jgi:predicted GNAT family N-acyltransferase